MYQYWNKVGTCKEIQCQRAHMTNTGIKQVHAKNLSVQITQYNEYKQATAVKENSN